MVEWYGPVDAEMYVIGEAPGKEEEKEGRPFVGASGKMLRGALRAAGMNPEEVRWGNVYPERPKTKGGKFWTGRARREAFERARKWVWESWGEGKPRVVMLVGEVPLQALTVWKRVKDVAGALVELQGGGMQLGLTGRYKYAGVVLHPAGLMRDPSGQLKPWFYRHVERYVDLLQWEAEIPEPVLLPLDDAAVYQCAGKWVVLDTEYSPETHYPHLVGLTVDGRHVWQVRISVEGEQGIARLRHLLSRCAGVVAHNWPADAEALAKIGIDVTRLPRSDTLLTFSLLMPGLPVSLSAVTRWYAWSRPWKWMRTNALADDRVYNALDVVYTWKVWQAEGQEVTWEGRKRGELVERMHAVLPAVWGMEREGMRVDVGRLQEEKRRHERRLWWYQGYVKRALERALRDVDGLTERERVELEATEAYIEQIRQRYVERARAHGCNPTFRTAVRKCDECARLYERFRSEVAPLKRARTKAKTKHKQAVKRAEEFDPANPHHMRWLLFDVWGLKGTRRRTKKGEHKVDVEELQACLKSATPEQQRLIRAVVRIRQLQKAISTFLTLDLDRDGYLHPHVKMHGTVSGRPSSGSERDADTDPDDPGAQSFNAFNIPKRYRAIFVPREEYVFVGGDYADLEGRLTGLDSADKRLCELYRQGVDVHSHTAAMLFDIDPEEAREYVVLKVGGKVWTARDLAKRTGHGWRYGMKYKKLAQLLGIPEKLAKELFSRFGEVYKGVVRWQQKIVGKVWGVRATGADGRSYWKQEPTYKLETVFGRVRLFMGARGKQENEALSFRPQSHGADVWYTLLMRLTGGWGVKVDAEEFDARVVTGTYDSMLCEVRKGQEERFAEWLKEVAEEPVAELETLPGARLMPVSIPFEVKIGKTYADV